MHQRSDRFDDFRSAFVFAFIRLTIASLPGFAGTLVAADVAKNQVSGPNIVVMMQRAMGTL